ncbi:HlyD family secretion protein [Vibrio olivae]|uniref:HlyD family secretion protein n=1 Tax=Vibrio olivae TaxID=1243002 RepID=A0ABV5HNC1_9VIBR
MDLLLILSYTALCITVFKVFRIPLNKWTVPTAVLGGIALIGTLILLMNYNHPFTQLGSQVFNTTPIVPGIRGRVTSVDVKPNQEVKAGDSLLHIDPTPFIAKVTQAQAALAEGEQDVLQLEATYKAAQSNTVQAQAKRDRAKREYERYAAGFKRGAFTEQQVDNRRQTFLAAEAALESSTATEQQAQLAYQSEINGENTTVANLEAALAQAEFNLRETVVKAPTDGFVTHLAVRPGMMAVPLPLAPVMTFVHSEQHYYIAAFRQNSLQRLKAGDEAEFVFRAIPGKVFAGKVVEVIPAIGEGQVQAAGALMNTESLKTSGRVMVKLQMTDDLSDYHMPLGVNAEVAVYSDHFEHVAIMRKVLIRVESWKNYLYLDH